MATAKSKKAKGSDSFFDSMGGKATVFALLPGFLIGVGIYISKVSSLEASIISQNQQIDGLRNELKDLNKKIHEIDKQVNNQEYRIGQISGKPAFIKKIQPRTEIIDIDLNKIDQKAGD